ncbi:MAG: dTDP-4-dehydrorhamnose 3,5-epimerase family protein [Sediminibacterium sp.]
MKINSIIEPTIEGVKLIHFERYLDKRGYFSETYRSSDFLSNHLGLFPNGIQQTNESYSRRNVLRGLHFQWNNPMGKLVRTISGHMIDLILDLRIGSPTQGKIMAFNMPIAAHQNNTYWIWVPEGCAHGNFFIEDSYIEYYCSASYNGECEAGVSPFANDIDWSICDPKLKNLFFDLKDSFITTSKDINGHSVSSWLNTADAVNFKF